MIKTPRTNFAKFVEMAEPTNRKLPLFHTCDGFSLRTIMEDEKLKVFPRESFDNQPILFFFYGRPAYRVSTTDEAASLPCFLPVCLILAPDSVVDAKTIYPFDTGAYENGLFSSNLHPHMDRDDFQLVPEQSMPQRLISRFFGTNDSYFLGIPLIDIEIPPFDFEAASYQNILKQESKTKPDDRRSTIEIHLNHNLSINKSNLEAVIIPSIFLDDVNTREFFVEKCNAEILPYQVYHFRILEYTSEIFGLARSFLGLDSRDI